MATLHAIHNGIMNKIDSLNHSDIIAPVKWVGLSGLNLAAAVNGVARTTFEIFNLAWQIPVALCKELLLRPMVWLRGDSVVRPVGREIDDVYKMYPYKQIPGFEHCAETFSNIGKQFAGVFTSLGGVLVVGSEYNVEQQHKLGNCSIDSIITKKLALEIEEKAFRDDHSVDSERASKEAFRFLDQKLKSHLEEVPSVAKAKQNARGKGFEALEKKLAQKFEANIRNGLANDVIEAQYNEITKLKHEILQTAEATDISMNQLESRLMDKIKQEAQVRAGQINKLSEATVHQEEGEGIYVRNLQNRIHNQEKHIKKQDTSIGKLQNRIQAQEAIHKKAKDHANRGWFGIGQ
jgi:transposase-like protein